MGNAAGWLFFLGVRSEHNLHSAVLMKIRGGRGYWQGRVIGKPGCTGESGGESFKSRAKSGHGVNPPKAARFALGIDHEGARIKAHPQGAFGPGSFVLTGE